MLEYFSLEYPQLQNYNNFWGSTTLTYLLGPIVQCLNPIGSHICI